eukprot:gene22774-biopygen17761
MSELKRYSLRERSAGLAPQRALRIRLNGFQRFPEGRPGKPLLTAGRSELLLRVPETVVGKLDYSPLLSPAAVTGQELVLPLATCFLLRDANVYRGGGRRESARDMRRCPPPVPQRNAPQNPSLDLAFQTPNFLLGFQGASLQGEDSAAMLLFGHVRWCDFNQQHVSVVKVATARVSEANMIGAEVVHTPIMRSR